MDPIQHKVLGVQQVLPQVISHITTPKMEEVAP